MLFKSQKKLDEQITHLRHEVSELKEIIKSEELIRLRNENAYLKERNELINHIKFKLKSVSYVPEENIILVKYDFPNIKIGLDSENKVIKNNMFFAINKLQLLPIEDLKKISVVVKQVENNK